MLAALNCHFRWPCIAAVSLAALFSVSDPVNAEVKLVKLPAAYANFALNPETGDVAALDPNANTVTLFRRAFLTGDTKAVVAPQAVGKTPSSVAFKRFADKSFFAVVCTQDSHIYLFDSGLKLLKKIPHSGTGASHIACSQNPLDPYLYYCHWQDRSTNLGVMDVRSLADQGTAFGSIVNCAVSASGSMVYCRTSGYSRATCTLRRTSGYAETKPTFTNEFFDRFSPDQFAPDPFDQFVAIDDIICTRDLANETAKLDFGAECFLETRPVVLGLPIVRKDTESGDDEVREKASSSSTVKVEVRAASSNSWKTIGRVAVTLPLKKLAGTQPLDHREHEFSDSVGVTWKTRLWADEKHGQAILASINHIALIPLADFKLPDEPLLQVKVEGAGHLAVGQKAIIKVEKLDQRAKLRWENLPDGAREVPTGLEWTPSAAQVASTTLFALLAHGTQERRQEVPIEVSYPSVALPFSGERVRLDPEGKLALCWTVPDVFDDGRRSPGRETSLAVVDLTAMKVVAEKKLLFAVGAAALTSEMVFLSESNGRAVQVLKTSNLERIKTVPSEVAVEFIFTGNGKTVFCTGEGSIFILSIPSLYQITVEQADDYGLNVFEDGQVNEATLSWPMIRGTLMDESGKKPLLLMAPQGFIGFELQNRVAGPPQDWGDEPVHMRHRSTREMGDRDQNIATTLSGYPAKAALELRPRKVRQGIHEIFDRVELGLKLSDQVRDEVKESVLLASVKIVDERDLHGSHDMYAAGKTVAVLFGRRLYRWTTDSLKPADFPSPLHFKRQQSAFALGAEGPTMLTHAVTGGKKPYEFSLEKTIPGMSIDAASGQVTVDGKQVVTSAHNTVLKNTALALQGHEGSSPAEQLRNYSRECIPAFTKLLGRKPTGVPFLTPVHVRVVDADGQSAQLRYNLFAEIPFQPLAEKLATEGGRPSGVAKAADPETPAREPLPEESDITGLARKLESLEARLDLMTRELERLVQLIEKKHKGEK